MGDLLARALDDFFNEIERAGGTFERRPPSGGDIRRAKLAVDEAVRERLQRTSEALKASKEQLIRQAIGRLVGWY